MKKLGRIEIGGSLDITNNKHVEGLLEEALKGIEIPEDTNTSYTLSQDGLTIQLVDGDGRVVSEIEIPEPEYKDPYQAEKEFIIPPANLFNMIRNGSYDDFDVYAEFEENDDDYNRMTIYLDVYRRGIVRTFILANREVAFYHYFSRGAFGDTRLGSLNLREIYKDGRDIHMVGFERTLVLRSAQIQTTEDSPLRMNDGLVFQFRELGQSRDAYFHIPFPNEETESEPLVIAGTLEEHLQNIYGYIGQ